MRTLALLFLGVVVGWAAGGVDWSRKAIGQSIEPSEVVEGEIIPDSGPVAPSTQNGRREKRIMVERRITDDNGVQRTVMEERVVPVEAEAGPVGKYQLSAYGTPSGHGCYIIDTTTGRTWHVPERGLPKRILNELPPLISEVPPADSSIEASTVVPSTTTVPPATYSTPSVTPEPDVTVPSVELPEDSISEPLPDAAE